jgi:hypothetical protein
MNAIYFPYGSLPTLIVGRVCWIMKSDLIATIKAAEIKFTRGPTGPKCDRQMVKEN